MYQILGLPGVQKDFENFLKENFARVGNGMCQCLICNKVTAHAGNMRQHFITHHSVGDKVHCSTCLRWFKNENSLNAHMSVYHKKKGML